MDHSSKRGSFRNFIKSKLVSSLKPPSPSNGDHLARSSSNCSLSETAKHINCPNDDHGAASCTFKVGVSEDRNLKCRRKMEDAHTYIYNYARIPDAGYFAVFDGHAGSMAAEWCSNNLHNILEANLTQYLNDDTDSIRSGVITPPPSSSPPKNDPMVPLSTFPVTARISRSLSNSSMIKPTLSNRPLLDIPALLDNSFIEADTRLEKLPLQHCGCTAAVAFMQWEANPQFIPIPPSPTEPTEMANPIPSPVTADRKLSVVNESDDETTTSAPTTATTTTTATDPMAIYPVNTRSSLITTTAARHRMLYTANVGDSRIILCRGGKALRLSYDHKGTDKYEASRITNAGGIMINGRVNGMLAVTRALGDTYVKEFVTGHPYTTVTKINALTDEFLIVACDGLFDVCKDQQAVDLVRNIRDPKAASQALVDYALDNFSSDNLSVMVIRLN